MKNYLHILKLRIKWRLSHFFELTSNECEELARWILRDIKESTEDCHMEDCSVECYKQKYECEFIADKDFG